jgi:hypothetical protein
MDLAVLGAQSLGLSPEDLDDATAEQLSGFVGIADAVIYRAGWASLFGIESLPKEETHPWTEQEEAEHNQQEPLPCHWDEL